MVLQELVHNAALLLAIVLIFDVRDRWAIGALSRRGTLVLDLATGAAVGVAALLILWSGVRVAAGGLVDTRSVLFFISGLYLGAVPTLVAAVMGILGRVFLVGGPAAATGVAVIVTSAGIGLLWRNFRRERLTEIAWYEFLTAGVIVNAVLLLDVWLFIGPARDTVIPQLAPAALVVFPLLTVALGLIAAARARRAVEHATTRLEAAALDAAADATAITDVNGNFIWVNPAFTQLTGYRPDEAIGRNPRDLQRSGEQDHAFYAQMWATLLAGKVWAGELTNRRKDGTVYLEEQSITPVMDDKGTVAHFIAFKRDITARRQLEAQYRQAQKMEGIGRLAGGIAHDLNNLLTVINGTVELALPSARNDPALRNDLIEIHRAGDRAAALTRQLLAFSRRQVMRPEVLDLNAVTTELLKMLTRVIGEDIVVETALAPDLGNIRADAGQVEQILMNLAVNARDAMPEGGTLTIATANVEIDEEFAARHVTMTPGRHVRLTVSDTGIGMDDATQARIFEPFFTTKRVGKGTGLGLSTVYGIVKQSGGTIWLYSEAGHGTTFKIYFPQVDDAARERRPDTDRSIVGGKETILVVEDEDAIRFVAARVLAMQGYRVLNAATGTDALAVVAAQAERVDLLLTDMVMPGMTGPELATAMVAKYPGLKVIFTSGYSADAVARQFGISEASHFISKPYGLADLAREVRRALDGA
ncbi:MAG: ATP-binding protein [Gemmatimonadaceae bacterium]